ncbi:MAG: hypothetical protein EA352_02435 [Gemmatimonadales bacterium]|nr:MAG: hypothetical protein EA352_02435 [Gemmatimonadales bacterium]
MRTGPTFPGLPDDDSVASRRLRISFDFVDPGSRLVHALLPEDLAACAIWEPLELAPPHRPPLDPAAPLWVEMHESLATDARNHGIALRTPDVVPRTRKAHELALHAAEQGCLPAILQTLFEAHFEAGVDLGRVDALVELASAVGLDPAETRTVLGVDRFRPAVEEARANILRRGVRGVPTLEWTADPGTPDDPDPNAPPTRLEGFRDPESLAAFLRPSPT